MPYREFFDIISEYRKGVLLLKRHLALSTFSLAVMLGAIRYGFAFGDFLEEGRIIWALAWGKVTLVDLYVGLLIFAGWVVHRERSFGRTAPWFVLLALLGNLAAAFYLLLALYRCQGDSNVFWHGKDQ